MVESIFIGSFFLYYYCFVFYLLLLFFYLKSLYFSDHFIVIWNVMLFNSFFYQLLLFLMLLTVCQKSSQKLHAIHRLLFGCLLSNDHNNCPHHAYKSSIDDFWDENADSGASSAYRVGFLKTLSTENVGIS